MENYIAGGLSGLIEVSATHWIDNIKTKQQEAKLTGQQFKFLKINPRTLYTGYVPRLVGVVPMRIVFWGTMKTANQSLETYKINPAVKGLLAGGFAGGCQSIIDNPIEVAKVRLITGGKSSIKELYRGFTPTLTRNILFAGILSSMIQCSTTSTSSKFEQFQSGAIGGVFASILTQPFDVIKTDFQRSKIQRNGHPSMIETFIKISRKNPSNLFAGLVPRAILSCATMSVGYVAFSYLSQLCAS